MQESRQIILPGLKLFDEPPVVPQGGLYFHYS